MSGLAFDLRLALRTLTNARGLSLAAVLALALAIGPTTAIFSVVHATLIAPMPYREPDQLVMVWSTKGNGYARTSAADYADWKERATGFAFLETYQPREVNLSNPQGPERLRARQVSPDGHRMLGEGVSLGRDFAPDEDEPGKDNVILLTNHLWRQRYDADPHVIGRQIRLDTLPYTIIGVLPPGPQDRRPADVWIPLTRLDRGDRRHRVVNVVGRLKPGVTLAQAQQEMTLIADGLARRYPESNDGWGVRVEPFQNNFLGEDTKTNLWLLLAAVGFVVLIACVNIAHLLVSRDTARAREMAIRAALGATRGQLVRLTLIESLVLAAIGGSLGGLSSIWILRSILALLPPFALSSEADPRLSVPVLLFTALTTGISGLLFGSLAAWQAGRLDLNHTLRQGAHGSKGRGRRARRGFVLAQFALAVTLLGGAGLTIFSFWNRIRTDLGLRTDHILTFSLTLPGQRFRTPEQIRGFYDHLLADLRAVPGVEHATLTSDLPFTTGSGNIPFRVVGREPEDQGAPRDANHEVIGSDYFRTFGIPLLQGRAIEDRDAQVAAPIVVVSQQFARQFLDGLDPVRQLLSPRDPTGEPTAESNRPDRSVPWQIVGVSGNVSVAQFGGDLDTAKIYVPFWQRPSRDASVAVRTSADPDTMKKSVAAAVHAIDPDLPLAKLRTMDQIVGERLARDRLNIALYGGLACIALLLATLGVYAAMAFMVAERESEIGLRMALGASQRQVMFQVLGEALALTAGGLLLGLLGAYALGRMMQSTLYGTSALSLPVWLAVSAILVSTALIACSIPARRASAVDPLILLRQE